MNNVLAYVIAKYEYGHIMVGDIALHRIDPKRGFFRLYAMTAERTLFGEPCLTIVWGRIGSKLRRRTEVFADEMRQIRRWKSLLSLRQRHGYVTPSRAAVNAPAVRGNGQARGAVHPRQLRLAVAKEPGDASHG